MKMKRILSLLLALILLTGTIPAAIQPASAAGPDIVIANADSGFVIENGVLTKYNGPGGNVVIPGGVTSIGSSAFSKCSTVTSVTIPSGVTSIGSSAFHNCSKLSSVTIPDSVTYIGSYAFANCTALTSITIPDSVTTLGGQAFRGCTSLTQVYGGNGVTEVEINSIFDGTPWPKLVQGDFAILGTILVRYNGTSPDVVIPEGITKINIGTFDDCDHVRSITLPSTIAGIQGICRAWLAPPPEFNSQHYSGSTVFPSTLVTLVFPTHGQLVEEFAKLSLKDAIDLFTNTNGRNDKCTRIENLVNCPNQAVVDRMEQAHTYLTTWTNPGAYVSEQSERVTKVAQGITAGLTTDYEKAKAIYSWVVGNMTYNAKGPNNLRNADKILDQMQGVCDDYSWLLMSLCRAVDIPAARVLGYREDEYHAWNMIFADGRWFWAESTFNANDYRAELYFDIGSLFLSSNFEGDSHMINGTKYVIPADIPTDWAQTEVWEAICKGVVPFDLQSGYRDAITREDFCRLMVALVEKATGTDINSYVLSKGLTITAPFTDTNTPEVLAAYALGIVKGSGAAFNPNGSITRQEAAAMLARTARVLGLRAGTPVRFADAGKISSWAVSEVDYISGITDPGSGRQVMGGVGGQRFDPLGSYTREQAIATALRLYGAAGKQQ